ncbi:hydroxyisourate hydrolase [Paenibacillus tarimensis]
MSGNGGRLNAGVDGTGRLTTHVLDLSCGRPAANMAVHLWRFGGDGQRELLRSAVTNADGRLDEPLLQGTAFAEGTYELCFKVGDYFRRNSAEAERVTMLFLEEVPIRFQVTEAGAHYHVPLLVAPGGYSTYRGS